MKQNQKITLRLKVHKALMEKYTRMGFSAELASNQAYKEVYGKTPLRLEQMLDAIARDKQPDDTTNE